MDVYVRYERSRPLLVSLYVVFPRPEPILAYVIGSDAMASSMPQ
jgi:hypothetical protein